MKISIIMPVYNEEKHIREALDSLLDNDFDFRDSEIIIVDGMSSDNTRSIIKEYVTRHGFIKLCDNPGKMQAKALNIGLSIAKGELIIRCDAHSIYPRDYIARLAEAHKQSRADNIGGVWETVPADGSVRARAIAGVMNSIFGTGLSYRTIKNRGDIFTDTVPFGSFKKTLVKKTGPYDESLKIGEDLDYNIRIRKNGGKILMLTGLVTKYIARGNFKKLAGMSFNYGLWKTVINRKHKMLTSVRHLFPPVFLLTLAVLIAVSFLYRLLFLPLTAVSGLYLLLCIAFSIAGTFKKRERAGYFFFMTAGFVIYHVFYGAGYIAGLTGLFSSRRNSKG